MSSTIVVMMQNACGKKCVFCNLGQDNQIFPAVLNRYGPINVDKRWKNRKSDSNGVIFRPYLNCEEDNNTKSLGEKEAISGNDVETKVLRIGFSENLTISDVIDKYGIFWAHEVCLIWSKSNRKSCSNNTEDDYTEIIEENLKQVRFSGQMTLSMYHDMELCCHIESHY